jgi:hypothetical protein
MVYLQENGEANLTKLAHEAELVEERKQPSRFKGLVSRD